MMKVAYIRKVNRVEIRDQPCPTAGAGQIVLRVEACGICGTDRHAALCNEVFQPFGHEVAGEIADVGDGVTWLKPGQKVALDSATPCGRCAMCRNGAQELCTDIQSFYFANSFGMAEYMVAPAISAIPYDGLSPAQATLAEPLGVAIDVVRVADVVPGGNVLLMGPGPIGLMALRLVRAAGAARIFVSALSGTPTRNALAREFGADAVIEVDREPLESFAFGCRIDRIISTTPPSTLPSALSVAAKGAIVAFIGLSGETAPRVCFDGDAFHTKKLQLRASFLSPALFGARAMDILRSDELIRERLISHTFPFAGIQEAMNVVVNDPRSAVKVVVTHGAPVRG